MKLKITSYDVIEFRNYFEKNIMFLYLAVRMKCAWRYNYLQLIVSRRNITQFNRLLLEYRHLILTVVLHNFMINCDGFILRIESIEKVSMKSHPDISLGHIIPLNIRWEIFCFEYFTFIWRSCSFLEVLIEFFNFLGKTDAKSTCQYTNFRQNFRLNSEKKRNEQKRQNADRKKSLPISIN